MKIDFLHNDESSMADEDHYDDHSFYGQLEQQKQREREKPVLRWMMI